MVKHVILPVLGMAAIAVPVYYLCKPGQPDPYDWFPYAALAPSWCCPSSTPRGWSDAIPG